MSNLSPAAILYDEAGNKVAVIIDGAVYRLGVDAKVTASALPTGAATEATLATRLTEADFVARVGAVVASPAANTVLGRLKDLYDRFIAQLPAALVGGRLDSNIGSWLGSTTPTVGQKVKAASLPVTFASDQEPFAVFVDSPDDADVGITTGTAILGGGTAATINAVRSTPYTEQTTNAVRSLKSTSANDAAAGTGARKVRVTYFDQAMAGPFTETVTLNGLTAVALVAADVCFIESLVVTEVGSGGANAGAISLYANNVGTGTVIGSIGFGTIAAGVGDNRTLWGHHYVPAGKTATLATYIVSAASGGSGTNATFFLRSKDPTAALAPDLIVSDLLVTVASIVRQLTNPIKIIGPARVTAYGVPAVNNATLNASFDFSERDT